MRALRRPRRGRPTDRCRTHVFHCRFHRGLSPRKITVRTDFKERAETEREASGAGRSRGAGARGKRRAGGPADSPRAATGGIPTEPDGAKARVRPCGAFPFAPEPAVPPRPGPVDRARAADSGAASRTNLTRKAVGRRIRARRQMSICGAARRQGPAAFRGRAYGCPGIRRASPTRTRTRSTPCGRGKL